MRIGVLSPVAHGTGASCLSMLLALRLGQGSTDKVCLTHVHPSDSTLREIAGVVGTVDKTTTPSMIIRTFQSAGAISEQEYAQYCAAVTREVDLFTCTRSGDVMCSYEDARYLSNYVMEKFPHKHVVVDADEHSENAMLGVIERCDVVVFVTRVSMNNIAMLKVKLGQYMKQGVLRGKRVMVVFNNYQTEVVQQKELAKILGVPVKAVYFMPLNPYIAWGTFNRKMPVLWNFIAKGDPRVAGVRLELDRMVAGMVQKQKVTAPAKQEKNKLFGVKYEVDAEEAARVKPDVVDITQASRDHAERFQQLTQTQPPVQRQTAISEGLPAGFGAPDKVGFAAEPEQTPPEQVQPVVEPVQETVAPVQEYAASEYTESLQELIEQEASDAQIPLLSAKLDGTAITKAELPSDQPGKTAPRPVELEPIIPKPPITRQTTKPVIPPLPAAVLKPRTQQSPLRPTVGNLPTSTIPAKQSGDGSKRGTPLSFGGLQTTTIGSRGGGK